MKRYLISFALLVLNILPMLAYDRHGRDYSVNGRGSSGLMILFIIAMVIFIAVVWIRSMFDNKDKK